jgi:Flp pilus assembly protein TadG
MRATLPASDATQAGDQGSALVEFVFLAVLLLVPIIYLVVALGRVQAGALAVEQGAREAGRVFVTSADEDSGQDRARAAAALAYGDQGFSGPGPGQLTMTCTDRPCLTPDGRVEVKAELTVGLPGVPRFVSHVIPLRITLSATHIATVDRFRQP